MSYDWDKGFKVDFNMETGFSRVATTTKRYLSQMSSMYMNQEEVKKELEQGDPLIYEFYELGCPEREGDLLFGTTILYPGKIGHEYYMTKGHFHTRLETAEVYYTLSGEGVMLLENPEGDTREIFLKKNEVVYVPRRYAHRTVNIGKEPLILYFTFPADAGHDYGTIETKGYRKVVMDKNDSPSIEDNPNWK